MLLFFVRKTKNKKPKVMIVFEPDEDFEAQFTSFVGEILNSAREKKAKLKAEKRVCISKSCPSSRKKTKIAATRSKNLQFISY